MEPIPVTDHPTVHVVACQVLESALRPLLDAERIPGLASCQFLERGLHTLPQKMTPQVQAALDAAEPPGVVLVGYGLCGNGVAGLQSRRHTLVLPRVDDCIALLLGSYERYVAEMQAYPGTYFVSKGWLEANFHPLGQYREWCPRYGEAQARYLVERLYENYRRIALVGFSPDELDACRPQAQEVAAFLGLAYDEIEGSPALFQGLVAKASRIARQPRTSTPRAAEGSGTLGQGPAEACPHCVPSGALSTGEIDGLDGVEHIVIPPGASVQQEMFIHW